MWTIATPFVNKPDIIPIWLESFKQLDFPRNEFKLLWVDMTDNPELTSLLKGYITEHGHEFAEVEYVDNPQLEHSIVSDPMLDPKNPLYKKKSLATDESMAIIRDKRKGHLLLWEDDTSKDRALIKNKKHRE